MYAKVKKSLPEMYALTVCMWLKSNASPGVGTPFSYAVPGQANELVLIEWGNNPMEILINDKVWRVCCSEMQVFSVLVWRFRSFCFLEGGKAAISYQRREVASYLRDLDNSGWRLGSFPRWCQEGKRREPGAVSSYQTTGAADSGPRAGKDSFHLY